MSLPQPPVAGVIGWPIAHSKSPLIHRFWLGKLGIDGDYSRFPVAPEHVDAFVRALPATGLRGVNVTVPHKLAVMAALDALSDGAAAVGAVNTIVVGENGRLTGHNSDVVGITGPAGAAIAGRPMLLIGSGGAARAAMAAARAAGASALWIMARNADAAGALLARSGLPGGVLEMGDRPPEDIGLVFNATSLGMSGQPPLHLDLGPLPGTAVVFDAVYAPLETGLLAAARARGLATIDGLAMLIGQAAEAFRLFYGADAPREHDSELRRLLIR
ncbi:shikimate dehydrogenase family protein [Sandarakinorhabdus rubra]|uniref:shikimate dehydrogenase family protein n=1 Tax=Sandarakinorhabdus rubra TaxID=2672568 RepID=UPI0013DB3A68|nr:shikimate dehydrogenase [Sandarakinorhabdus rubra]